MDKLTDDYFLETEHHDKVLIPLLNFIPLEILHLVFPPRPLEEWTVLPGGRWRKRQEGAP